MHGPCPRCGSANTPAARYCARCGLSLTTAIGGTPEAGRIRHPNALPAPAGYEPFADAADLYWHWESAWGGKRLLGTESIGVLLFNAGYPLSNVTVQITGESQTGRRLFEVQQTAEELPRGEPVMVEVASYDIPSPPERLRVSLVSAEFGAVD